MIHLLPHLIHFVILVLSSLAVFLPYFVKNKMLLKQLESDVQALKDTVNYLKDR